MKAEWRARGHELFRWTGVAALVTCYTTILLGGEVIASGSGLGCPDWPSCRGNFFPAFVGPAAVEWSHRLSAGTLTIFVTTLFLLALVFEQRRPTLVRLSSYTFSLVLLEALLGGFVVKSLLTPWLVVLHFAVATVILGLLVLLVFLGHLPNLPRGWVDWAHAAARERPVPPTPRPAPGGPVPGGPSPDGGPIPGMGAPGPGAR